MTTYIASLEKANKAAVTLRAYPATTVAVITKQPSGLWRTEIQANGGIRVDSRFDDTKTWQEAAHQVARWGGNSIEIQEPES